MNTFDICSSEFNPIIYVVVAFGGQYDDAWESNMIASFDKEVAQKYIADQPERQKMWDEKGEEFQTLVQSWEDSYLQKNPVPAWINADSNAACDEWVVAKDAAYKAYTEKVADSLGLDLQANFEDGASFDIQEVKVMEKYDSFGR